MKKILIIGAGNIGTSIAKGLVSAELFQKQNIILTRRHLDKLDEFKKQGFVTTRNNIYGVKQSETILLCVEPQQADMVLSEISEVLDSAKHTLISVVSGLNIQKLRKELGNNLPIIRAMPNTAIAIRQSMTCLTSDEKESKSMQIAKDIFNSVGKTAVIDEDRMPAATSLTACGIAFFLRAIRAASQGGIEIGFHSGEALEMAAQTAKGAAELLLNFKNHPEYEIDRVTTPLGCTISGLNQLEHDGFSSAMIKGIKLAADKAANLYEKS